MEKYLAEETKITPYIELDHEKRILVFKGQSYPENAYKVFEPVFNWIDDYFEEDIKEETKIKFQLSYINTSSTKCLLILFEKLNEAHQNENKITVDWYYDEENGYDYEMGQDFKEDVEMPFNFISIN